MAPYRLLLLAGACGAHINAMARACSTDLDCSLNGVCDSTSHLCACDPWWHGFQCQYLTITPAAAGGAYGYDGAFNVTSWGGNAVQQGGKWHGYFTEMAGAACGLHEVSVCVCVCVCVSVRCATSQKSFSSVEKVLRVVH